MDEAEITTEKLEIRARLDKIYEQVKTYPPPIAGCDEHPISTCGKNEITGTARTTIKPLCFLLALRGSLGGNILDGQYVSY